MRHYYGCIRARALLLMTVLIPLLEGCAVVAVAETAAAVLSTTVEVGAKAVGAAVNVVTPDSDQVGAKAVGVAVDRATPDSIQEKKTGKKAGSQ